MTILLLTPEGIYISRDRKGRTPAVIGRKEGAFCVSFESFAYINLGFTDYRELGPGEIVLMKPEGIEILKPGKGRDENLLLPSGFIMDIRHPSYEGINVEEMRYNCGRMLAKRDHAQADLVAGIPDSGIAHAIGYANESGIPFSRPFIKVHPNLAAFLYADQPEPEKSDRPDEADTGRLTNPRQEPPSHRRLHCTRHTVERNDGIPVSERRKGSAYPPCMPAAFIRM